MGVEKGVGGRGRGRRGGGTWGRLFRGGRVVRLDVDVRLGDCILWYSRLSIRNMREHLFVEILHCDLKADVKGSDLPVASSGHTPQSS